MTENGLRVLICEAALAKLLPISFQQAVDASDDERKEWLSELLGRAKSDQNLALALRVWGWREPPGETTLPERPAIRKRNLLFYIMPLQNPLRIWQWHVAQLRKHLHLFNGRKLVIIATPEGGDLSLEPASLVKAEFGPDAAGIEFLERPNDPEQWEAPAFREMLSMVSSTANDEASFYFHAKGVRRHDQAAVRPWCEAIYKHNLERASVALDALRFAKAVGIALRPVDPTGVQRNGLGWHFAGTGFWFRHDALFGTEGWQRVSNHTHGVEAYLASRFRRDEVKCLAMGELAGDPYHAQTWVGEALRPPRISVIVTARNYGRYLQDCLESCLWQSVQPHEVIYCDDASTDRSLRIAREFEGVRAVALGRHRGVVGARNQAACYATGEALLFVDGDNILPVNYLERMQAALSPSTSFAYSDLAFFGQETSFHRQPDWWDFELWVENHCDTCSLMWRRLFVLAGGWIGGPWAHMEDYHLFLRLSCFGGAQRANVALGYRKHGASLSAISNRDNDPAELRAAYERIQADVTRWAEERFGRLPSRRERDLGVLGAAEREL